MDTVALGASSGPASTRLSLQLGDAQSGLRAVTESTGSAVVVHVGGDIDASNEAVWQRLVTRSAAIAVAPGPFVIDVRDLEFMGSCAYAVLAQESVRCRRRGVNLRLVSNQPIVARTIAACGLRRLLPMYSSVENALAPPADAHCAPTRRATSRAHPHDSVTPLAL
ncbi:anti-sigma factor antagonist [Mycobacterium kansasii]|uniref:Anti-sigma factor antagonist n=3 Tax=Mycobacterium kansasii TaxID=1768 RepID=A0A7G1IAM6_MYCKA|nr:anti-sigma factor antagonist [Mycobacterium kansasii]